jgi:hypothetical protein
MREIIADIEGNCNLWTNKRRFAGYLANIGGKNCGL